MLEAAFKLFEEEDFEKQVKEESEQRALLGALISEVREAGDSVRQLEQRHSKLKSEIDEVDTCPLCGKEMKCTN